MNLSAIVIRQAATQSINIALMIYCARSLDMQDFAFLLFSINIYGSLILLLDTGLWSYYQRTSRDEANKIHGSILKINSVIGLVAASLLIVFFTIFDGSNVHGKLEKITIIIVVLLAAANQIYQSVAAHYEKNFLTERLAIVEIIQAALFASIVFAVVYFSGDIWIIIFAFASRSAFSLVIFNDLNKVENSYQIRQVCNIFSKNKHLVRQAALFQANKWLSAVRDIAVIWMVTNYLGKEGYGVYSWLVMLGGYGSLILMIQQRLYLPYFALLNFNQMITEHANVVIEFIKRNVIYLYPSLFFALLHLDELVVLVFGNQWSPFSPLVPFFCASMLFTPITIVLVSYFDGISKSGINFLMNIFWTVATIIAVSVFSFGLSLEQYAIIHAALQLLNVFYIAYFYYVTNEIIWLLKIVPSIAASILIAFFGEISFRIITNAELNSIISYATVFIIIFTIGLFYTKRFIHVECSD